MAHCLSSINIAYSEMALMRIAEIAKNGSTEERERVLKILLQQSDDLRDEIKRKITERTNYINWMLIAFGAMFSFSFAGMYHYVFSVIAAPWVALCYWQYFQNSCLGHQKIVNFLRDFVEPGIELLSENCARGWQCFLRDQREKPGDQNSQSSTSNVDRSSFSFMTLIAAPIMFLSLYVVQTWLYPPPSSIPYEGTVVIVLYYLLYASIARRSWKRVVCRFRSEGIDLQLQWWKW